MPSIEHVRPEIIDTLSDERQKLLELLMQAEEDALKRSTDLQLRGATPDLWQADTASNEFKSMLDQAGFAATDNHIDIFELICKILPIEEIDRLYNQPL